MFGATISKTVTRMLVVVMLAIGLVACGGSLADGTATPADSSGGAAATSVPGVTTTQHTVTVNGTGIVSVVPDTANATIGAMVTDTSVATALNDVDQRVNAIVKVLHDNGVADQDIKTTNFSVTVNYDYNSPARPITGYTVTHLLRFSVSPVAKIGTIIGVAVDAGANQVSSIVFTTADPSSATQQARAKAVDDALMKAQQLASAANMQVGSPISMSEGTSVTPIDSKSAVGGTGASGVTIEGGQQQIEVDVVVTYELQ